MKGRLIDDSGFARLFAGSWRPDLLLVCYRTSTRTCQENDMIRLLAPALLVLGACSPGDSEGGQTAGPTAQPSAERAAPPPAGTHDTTPAADQPPAPAEPWTAPSLYAVTGVAPDDVLNVRAEPGPDAAKLAGLQPDERPVEVIEIMESGGQRWGRVLAEGRPGWVNMAYLEEIDFERVADSAIPAALMCTGTEPFWGLEFSASSATYTDPEIEAPSSHAIAAVTPAAARGAFPAAVTFEDADWAVIARERCSDGMSSDDYQWSVQYFTRLGGEPVFLQGCCRIEPD